MIVAPASCDGDPTRQPPRPAASFIDIEPPPDPGLYLLLVAVRTPRTITVGRLGEWHFERGHYCYVGSAMGPGGLGARLARHSRSAGRAPDKNGTRTGAKGRPTKHWHIDHLLDGCDGLRHIALPLPPPLARATRTTRRAFVTEHRPECALAACVRTGTVHSTYTASIPVVGFGASDCTCQTHLFAVHHHDRETHHDRDGAFGWSRRGAALFDALATIADRFWDRYDITES